MDSYDLIVIGSGSAATSAVFKCIEKGWKVAVIDRKAIGGTCALRGCDPKKVLVGVTESVEAVKRLEGNGISLDGVNINWPDLITFKGTFTEPMSNAIESSLTNSGADIYHGQAEFVSVNGVSVGGRTISGNKILIASGVKAADPGFPGSEFLVDNEEFLSLPDLPEKVLFVGGGYISVEFANIVRKAGSHPTIVQGPDRMLTSFDEDMVSELTKSMEESGIGILTSTSVESIKRDANGYRVVVKRHGKEQVLEADLVVHGAGRTFDPEMGLSAANVEWSRRGVKVNEFLQSVSNPNVYAAGDSADTGSYKLTPVAGIEGSVAADNMLSGNTEKADYTGIPTVVFSSPPLSMVGMTEAEAKSKGISLKVNKGDLSSWYNSRRRGIRSGYYKILIDEGNGMVVGAHIFAENAEETINIFSLAIREKISVERLISVPYAYPSDTNDIRYMLG